MLMLSQVIAHTPRWVFVLFFALIVLGVQQLLPRPASLRRVSLLPVAMVAFSLSSMVTTFSDQPVALLGWLTGAAASTAMLLMRPLPAGTRFDPATQRFTLPGSVVPLALMMAIFFSRYAANVALAISPRLAHDAGFALAAGFVLGALSGAFLGRAARLWRLAAAQSRGLLTAAP